MLVRLNILSRNNQRCKLAQIVVGNSVNNTFITNLRLRALHIMVLKALEYYDENELNHGDFSLHSYLDFVLHFSQHLR